MNKPTVTEDPSLIRQLKGHKQSIMALDLHPQNKYVASAGMDNVILLWNLNKSAQPARLQSHKAPINCLRFSPNGNILVSASSDESLKFWEVSNSAENKEVTLIKAHNSRIRAVDFSCDGLLLSSCGDDSLVKIWSTVDRRLQFTLKKHQNWIRYCQFSPTAANLVSCDDKVINIWDMSTKKVIQSYQQHQGVIHQAKFHSLGNCLASCSHDKKIKLYDLRSQSVIQIYEGHDGPVKSIDFHPYSPYLISSSEDGNTILWNSQKGKLQYTLESHSNVSKFSRFGDYFITGGSEKTINLWKCGFFDSLKEKIVEHSPTRNQNKNKIIQNQQQEQQQQSKRVVAKEENSLGIHDSAPERQTKGVVYNHRFEQFELEKPNEHSQEIKKSQNNKLLPEKLITKMQKINHQISFITKTTQILQSRVLNNGEQLSRILSIVDGLQN